MIEAVRRVRRASVDALAGALQSVSDHRVTEVELRDAFHERLSDVPELTAEGWYSPPPLGLIVAIGNPPEFGRLHQASYRTQSAWPSDDVRLDGESILYCYGSHVHVPTGAIGDLACSLYRGGNRSVHAHVRNVWDLTIEIASQVSIGMPISELHGRAMQMIEGRGYQNNVLSVSDPDLTNVGHTIPWSHEAMTPAESSVLRTGTPSQIADLVSGKRHYVSATESLTITESTALTIEPRLSAPGLPTVNFHVVVGFEKDERVIVSELDPLFDLFDMTGFDV